MEALFEQESCLPPLFKGGFALEHIVDDAPLEEGAEDPGCGQILQRAGEGIAVDDDQVRVSARYERADLLPAQDARRCVRPHREGIVP